MHHATLLARAFLAHQARRVGGGGTVWMMAAADCRRADARRNLLPLIDWW
jgi:hypothetical protein